MGYSRSSRLKVSQTLTASKFILPRDGELLIERPHVDLEYIETLKPDLTPDSLPEGPSATGSQWFEPRTYLSALLCNESVNISYYYN